MAEADTDRLSDPPLWLRPRRHLLSSSLEAKGGPDDPTERTSPLAATPFFQEHIPSQELHDPLGTLAGSFPSANGCQPPAWSGPCRTGGSVLRTGWGGHTRSSLTHPFSKRLLSLSLVFRHRGGERN